MLLWKLNLSQLQGQRLLLLLYNISGPSELSLWRRMLIWVYNQSWLPHRRIRLLVNTPPVPLRLLLCHIILALMIDQFLRHDCILILLIKVNLNLPTDDLSKCKRMWSFSQYQLQYHIIQAPMQKDPNS
jgi:hypothetical protein